MALVLKGSRKYPSVPNVTEEPKNHTQVLMAMKESLEIGQRRTSNLLDSFVRVQDLMDLGLITFEGNTTAIVGADLSQIANIGDLTGSATGDFLRYDGTDWVNDQLHLTDITQAMVTQHQAALSIDWSQIVNETLSGFTTTDLTEGSNLYFTNERVDDRVAVLIQNGTGISWSYNDGSNTFTPTVSLAAFSTTNLPEGSNLYFTDERVDDRVAALIQNGTGITWSYNDGSNTLTPTVSLAAFSTTNLSEGSNLYFTDERVDDRVAALIQNGTGITWSYNDGSNTFTPTVSLAAFSTTNLSEGSNLYFTDERAQDAVGTILTDSTTIDFTYTDASNTITAAVIQSFAYEWSATHGWTDNSEIQLGTGNDLRLFHDGTNSFIRNDTGSLKIMAGAVTAIEIDSAGLLQTTIWANGQFLSWKDGGGTTRSVFGMSVVSGADRTLFNANGTNSFMQFQVAGAQVARFVTAGHFWMQNDSQEIQLGASNDLRVYHDGTDSVIENDTGNLILRVNGELSLDEVTSSTSATGGSATALPALPQGYMTVIINGTSRKIPYYAT